MFCTKCGKELPAEARFCFICGSRIERSQTAPSAYGLSEEKDGKGNAAANDGSQDGKGIVIEEEGTSATVFGTKITAGDPTALYVKIVERILQNHQELLGKKETHFTADPERGNGYTGKTRMITVGERTVYVKTGFSTKDKWNGIKAVCKLAGIRFGMGQPAKISSRGETSLSEEGKSGIISGIGQSETAGMAAARQPQEDKNGKAQSGSFVPHISLDIHSSNVSKAAGLAYYCHYMDKQRPVPTLENMKTVYAEISISDTCNYKGHTMILSRYNADEQCADPEKCVFKEAIFGKKSRYLGEKPDSVFNILGDITSYIVAEEGIFFAKRSGGVWYWHKNGDIYVLSQKKEVFDLRYEQGVLTAYAYKGLQEKYKDKYKSWYNQWDGEISERWDDAYEILSESETFRYQDILKCINN